MKLSDVRRNSPAMLLFLSLLTFGLLVILLTEEIWKNNLYQVHTIFELICIGIGISAFLFIWVTFVSNSEINRFIGFAFFIVVILDIFHTFYYQFDALNSREIATKFWVLGRTYEAITFILISVKSPRIKLSNKYKSLLVFAFMALIPVTLTLQYPNVFQMWSGGVTPLKIFMEAVIIAFLIVAFTLLKSSDDFSPENKVILYSAILFEILAELCFILYIDELTSIFSLGGHVFRIITYSCIFKSIVLELAGYPFRTLKSQLQLSNNIFQQAFVNSPIGMGFISIDGKWIDANHSLCDILSYTKEDLFNSSYKDIIHQNEMYEFDDVVDRLLKAQMKSYSLETRYQTKDGKTIWILINKSLIVDEEKKPRYILTQMVDVTERKEADELRIRVAGNEARFEEGKKMDKLRTDFFANLSHEFRTPLNVAFSALQLLNHHLDQEKIDPDKCRQDIHFIRQNCYRLMRLTNNLIDITKIDAGYFHLDFKNHNLVSVVEDIVLSVVPYAKAKGINLIFDSDTEEKRMALDDEKMERVMLNLLSNAIKFSNPGDEITVNIEDREDTVEIFVRDTGVGIAKEHLELIFQRFHQVDQTLTRNAEGSGIGLSLVKALVEMHGGGIHAESEIGRGTTFIIWLPVRTVEESESHPTLKQHDHRVGMVITEFSDIYH